MESLSCWWLKDREWRRTGPWSPQPTSSAPSTSQFIANHLSICSNEKPWRHLDFYFHSLHSLMDNPVGFTVKIHTDSDHFSPLQCHGAAPGAVTPACRAAGRCLAGHLLLLLFPPHSQACASYRTSSVQQPEGFFQRLALISSLLCLKSCDGLLPFVQRKSQSFQVASKASKDLPFLLPLWPHLLCSRLRCSRPSDLPAVPRSRRLTWCQGFALALSSA